MAQEARADPRRYLYLILYFRLPPPASGSSLDLSIVLLAGSEAANEATLHTNYPAQEQLFRLVPFANDAGDKLLDPSVGLKITISGAYEYFVTFKAKDSAERQKSHPGFFVVDPRLQRPNIETTLPLDGINILTVIPKWMPTVENWSSFFKDFAAAGYNMVHFAPVNTRGISNSPYAIYDQLSISDDLFREKMEEDAKEDTLRSTIIEIQKKHGILSASDIVWNHTACNSEWLQDHPEAGYNLRTAPHLHSAFELDSSLLDFSGQLKNLGLDVINEDHPLGKLMELYYEKYLPAANLWQFYVIDTQLMADKFEKACKAKRTSNLSREHLPLSFVDQAAYLYKHAGTADGTFGRYSKSLDIKKCVPIIEAICEMCSKTELSSQIEIFKRLVDEINLSFYKEWDADLFCIKQNISSRASFLRVDSHGPRLGPISVSNPLVDSYFTRLPKNPKTAKLHPNEMMLANNGWIWNGDPLVNFAGPQSKAYLLRQVIAWGDCVKLRYGDKPEDSSWLWEHQKKYTLKMASLFCGLRIDNCHSTPIHVASYFLDAARNLNPNLYVFAELFTGSEEQDIMFVSKLGINSLIREAMQPSDTAELSRLAHRFGGGNPIGSFTISASQYPLEGLGHKVNDVAATRILNATVDVKGCSPHAMFMDCTHDNETPHQKRTGADTLSTAAIVAMSCCAVGSVKGFDELVPNLLNVVSETSKYRLARSSGIVQAKAELSKLHLLMAEQGYSQVHVHQENDFISIHRKHPTKNKGYLLIARTAFRSQNPTLHSNIHLANENARVLFGASISIESEELHTCTAFIDYDSDDERAVPHSPTNFFHSFGYLKSSLTDLGDQYCCKEGCITGLASKLDISYGKTNMASSHFKSHDRMCETEIIISSDFAPGSIIVYETWAATQEDGRDNVAEQVLCGLGISEDTSHLESMINMGRELQWSNRNWYSSLEEIPAELRDAVKGLSMTDINMLVYRSASEDKDTGISDAAYEIPGLGVNAYCGIQGFVTVLQNFVSLNDMGHSLCSNLRGGDWMIDYIIGRMDKLSKMMPSIELSHKWLKSQLSLVKRVSISLKPKYFAMIVLSYYHAIRCKALIGPLEKFGRNLSTESTFDIILQSSIMTTYQLYGSVRSSGLFPKPYPGKLYVNDRPKFPEGWGEPCLAAGLPHFATEYLRCWGRDTFVALNGLLILPGFYDAARVHIIAFGSTIRHGLVPNLLDSGVRPRYNARDATWFWMKSVSDYCSKSPEGFAFLDTVVHRRFIPASQSTDKDADTHVDPSNSKVFEQTSKISELCQEILERHAIGIEFREYQAGGSLDHAMQSEGFNISINTDFDQGGFVSGGNRYNCGTWMDKMGDSGKAGNKGWPATPRDGAPIELTGLLKFFLNWIVTVLSVKAKRYWTWEGVTVKGKLITYKCWNESLLKNFEWMYYVSESDAKAGYRAGIYKDTFGSSIQNADSQLRPNQCIAMVVAPELFDPEHARKCLEIIKDVLASKVGIRTLDPKDADYRGYYENDNDGTDFKVAHGFNYHQGPEWGWVMAYFLRAYHLFNPNKPISLVEQSAHIISNPFKGITELTNDGGAFCPGSCPTQAWSSSCLIELLADLTER